jgi:hypothetical protein
VKSAFPLDFYIEEAKGVTVSDAGLALGLLSEPLKNYVGPCPSCGGNDRFSINVRKQAFNCRSCGGKGMDGIGLYALAGGYNLKSRAGFLAACSEALGGQPIPEGAERETDEEKQARVARIAAQKRANAERAAERDQNDNAFRQREINQARGLYLRVPEGTKVPLLREYLRRRTGFAMHDAVFANLRLAPNMTYWHGRDARGHDIALYAGPCMVAPFVRLDADLNGAVTGCHQTWLDLGLPPKFRIDLGIDDKGKPLPAKKMRGAKMGSFIPLFGRVTSARWVGGEGIENGLTIAGAEGFRADTFYFAAGDLGNLAGPADPKSAFGHPHDTYQDKAGRIRAVHVQGPVPRPGQTADDAMQVPAHVTELLLLADGDSEPVMTAACMARAEARFARPGRDVWEWRAPDGTDFSSFMTAGMGA